MPDKNQENITALMQEATPRARNTVAEIMNVYKSIKWKHVAFIIPTNPEPSHRPRLSGYRFYVPGAAKNQSFFNREVLPTLNGLFISTPCKIKVDIYVQTPKSFSMVQKILAEMRILRPWGNIGDVDNFLKSVLDQMQPNEKRGHVGFIKDDKLVVSDVTNKYYSMTPRYEIEIAYMGKIPDGLKRVLRLLDDQ